jgi:hypothetical protein
MKKVGKTCSLTHAEDVWQVTLGFNSQVKPYQDGRTSSGGLETDPTYAKKKDDEIVQQVREHHPNLTEIVLLQTWNCRKNLKLKSYIQVSTEKHMCSYHAACMYSMRHLVSQSFIHSVVCLTTGPQPLPKRVLHWVRSSASSFNFQYLLFSLRSSSSCLCLLPRLPVIYILSSNFPSITCFRRQFLRKKWPIQLAFLLFIVCRRLC